MSVPVNISEHVTIFTIDPTLPFIAAVRTPTICPGCRADISPIVHDYSLCSQLQNALYRIRQLENKLENK